MPTPCDTFQVWLRRAKQKAGISIRGLGFHAEKCAEIRDPWFRSLDSKTKEKLSRTNHKTLIRVYDEVELDELLDAIRRREAALRAGGHRQQQLPATGEIREKQKPRHHVSSIGVTTYLSGPG